MPKTNKLTAHLQHSAVQQALNVNVANKDRMGPFTRTEYVNSVARTKCLVYFKDQDDKVRGPDTHKEAIFHYIRL